MKIKGIPKTRERNNKTLENEVGSSKSNREVTKLTISTADAIEMRLQVKIAGFNGRQKTAIIVG